jgi:hypothetical protein
LLLASSRGVSHGRETSSPGGKVGDGQGDGEVEAAMAQRRGRRHRGRRRRHDVSVEGGDNGAEGGGSVEGGDGKSGSLMAQN